MSAAGQARLATRVRAALAGALAGSSTALRGSLARGDADGWSDVDLLWVVPDGAVDAAAAALPDALATVAPVLLLRSDPELGRSPVRRLLYANLAGLPVWWRVDVDLRAARVAGDEAAGLGDPAARGGAWSLPASALMNAIAADKALRRGRPEEAAELLARGFARLGAPPEPGAAPDDLAALAFAREPALRRVVPEPLDSRRPG